MPDDLIDFLFRMDEKRARELAPALEAAGVRIPMMFGNEKDGEPPNPKSKEDRETERYRVLLEVIRSSLTKAVEIFDQIDQKVVAHLRKVERWKTGGALVTTILSSGVVAALTKEPQSVLALPAGILSLVSAILTVLIVRLEGGDLNIARDYGAVAAKHEAARSLVSRISAYETNPRLFDDVDARYKEAEELVQFLRVQARRWGIVV